jgi:hypothetical protein
MTANEKRSAALKGRKKSPEHVEKVRLANFGQKRSPETRLRLRLAHLGVKLTSETRAKLSEARKREYAEGRRLCCFTAETQAKTAAKAALRKGPAHPRWIADRNRLSARSATRNMADFNWSVAVKRRDKCKCVLASLGGCAGRLEAHHIHSWKGYPELRYEAKNGVSLCHSHHPRKQSEAQALAPLFESMVAAREG